jgi:hypothetical protein
MVGLPGLIITILSYALFSAYLWMVRKKQLKKDIPVWLEAAGFTLLAGALFIVFYSPHHQYQYLKGQYDDAIKRRETAEAILKQARADQIDYQSLGSQLGAKIDALNEGIKAVKKQNEEILRNLPKPKGK